MNYQHSYHAGNFADVFKHIVLVALIQSLLRKETAFCYLDTHAGVSQHDLLAENAQKTQEFTLGIEKIFTAEQPPALIQQYLACVKKLNPTHELRFYPGSSSFVHSFLRPQDRMILGELHPDNARLLKQFFTSDKRVAVHQQDGYQSLKAFLPPKERRGLVLIDPPYEKPDELLSLPAKIATEIKRWETGIYAIWYPIKTRELLKPFYRAWQTHITRPMLVTELCVYPDDHAGRLNGSGMLIINPPWQLDQQLETVLGWVWKRLSIQGQGEIQIYHLLSIG